MAHAADLLQEGAGEVEFLRLLGEIADVQVLPAEDGSRVRVLASDQDLEERRLAGAVRTDKAELVPFRELEVDVREQEPAAVGLRYALEAHDPRTRGALAEGEAEVGVVADVLEGAETVQLDHLLRDRVEEELVVAGQEDGRVDLEEDPLDRLDRVDVHVVRRLVEQEDVLLLRVREGARGEDLRLLPAGEGAEPLVEELLADAQVIEDRVVHDHALAAGGTPGRRGGIRTGPCAR